ncbi:MAG: ribosome silencing factor [Candidatus Dormibacteraeota bacterium]|nr:ribosome silencing factor [Candidatus Dormibacteraeota bacterium]
MTSRALATLIREAALAKKARDVVEIDLRGRSSMSDYFVVCEGDTDRQTRAIADAIREAAEEAGLRPFQASGEADGAWILLDYVDVVAHVFLPGERAFYDLEALWKAPPMVKAAAAPRRPRKAPA